LHFLAFLNKDIYNEVKLTSKKVQYFLFWFIVKTYRLKFQPSARLRLYAAPNAALKSAHSFSEGPRSLNWREAIRKARKVSEIYLYIL